MEISINWFSCIIILVVNSVVVYCQGLDGFYDNLLKQNDVDSRNRETVDSLARGYKNFRAENRRFQNQEPADITPEMDTSFDFIVVGAGTAGAAVAARLSENPHWTVLLIEAGGSETLYMDIPFSTTGSQFHPSINWMDNTAPATSICMNINERQCTWPRGKVMGGSSILSTMVSTRGDRRDYDSWAQMGNDGWSWRDVLPYFKKLETMGVEELRNDRRYHNYDGPVYTGSIPYRTQLSGAFLKATAELGYKQVDYNGASDLGFSYMQVQIKNGTRVSSNRAYLHPVSYRRNLFVTKNSVASKIIIDRRTNRAFGVEFEKVQKIRVYAMKEVILCAGAIGTSQLLMLSGIGPAKHLLSKGITPLIDSPVGQNLQDHVAYIGLTFKIDLPNIPEEDLLEPHLMYLRDFFVSRTGPLTIPAGVEALGFINVDNPNDYPNIEFAFLTLPLVTVPNVTRDNINFGEYVARQPSQYMSIPHTWSVRPILMKPNSRRSVLLRDANINSSPILTANTVNDAEDVRILVKGIKVALEISRTASMRRFGSNMNAAKVQGCENLRNNSDEYWECAVRKATVAFFHYSGTCKMGPRGDPTAVVNPRLKVNGVQGLRVADASIMPEIITGHTAIPVIMIAEKLADMVKQDWGYPTEPLPY